MSDNLPKLNMSSDLATTINNIEGATKLAEFIAKSSYAKNFETTDDNNNTTVRLEDIVSAILFGAELGLSPMKTMALGSQLNQNAYYSIVRGKAMGLDEVTSLNNIYAWKNKSTGKIQMYTGIHVVSKVLTSAGVDREWVDDYRPVYRYFEFNTGEEIDSEKIENNPELYFIVKKGVTEDLVKEAKSKGCIFVNRVSDRLTSCIFKRKGFTPSHIKFYLSEAIEAELYKGVKQDGTKVDGKDNWNKYPARQMRNRVLIYGGREMAADKLLDTLIPDEISSITGKNTNNDVVDLPESEYEQIN